MSGMTWIKTVVPLTGSSQVILQKNKKRRAFMILNPSNNSPVVYDFTGETVAMDTGIQLLENEWERRDGDDSTIGEVTAMGTNGQNLIVWEGERR